MAWIKPRPSTRAGSKGSVFVDLPFVVVTHESWDQSVNVLFCSVQFWNQKPWSQQYQPGYY